MNVSASVPSTTMPRLGRSTNKVASSAEKASTAARRRTLPTIPIRVDGFIESYCTCLQDKIEASQRPPSDRIPALSGRAQAGHARLAFKIFTIALGFLYDLTPAGVIPVQDGGELLWRRSNIGRKSCRDRGSQYV